MTLRIVPLGQPAVDKVLLDPTDRGVIEPLHVEAVAQRPNRVPAGRLYPVERAGLKVDGDCLHIAVYPGGRTWRRRRGPYHPCHDTA